MASSSKRSYDDMVESDEEEDSYGRRALPVANLPEDFDAEPMDGMQYLFTVRRDARRLPSIVCVDNPYAIPTVLPGPSSTARPLNTPHPALPSEEWRHTFLRRFRNFRKNCTQSAIGVGPNISSSSKKIMPDKKDREKWWSFISGKHEAEWNPIVKPKKEKPRTKDKFRSSMRGWDDEDDAYLQEENYVVQETYRINDEGEVELVAAENINPAHSLPTPGATPIPDGTEAQAMAEVTAGSSKNIQPATFLPRQPTPHLLSVMDNRYSLHLLMYFGYWIEQHLQSPEKIASRITVTHARWVFSLLSRVDEHLSSDEINTLRVLARRFISLLGEASEVSLMGEPHLKDENLNSPITRGACWMVITTVADFWGQKDLWMDAESALASV